MEPSGRSVSIAEARRWFSPSGRYLDTAAIGLPPETSTTALDDAIRAWRAGEASPLRYDDYVDGSRAAFAELVGVEASRVAVGPQVSPLVGLVASSLPEGAEVVCPEEDFTSLLFPFLVRQPAITVRTGPLRDLAELVRPSTTMVAFSLVQSADGTVADAASIREAATRYGALTLADATQACGWMPVCAGDYDVLVAGTYKWLLAPRGSAFMTLRPELVQTITPASAGWYAGADRWSSIYGPPLRLAPDARRFDVSPAWLTWVGTLHALDAILSVGVDSINRHDLALANSFRELAGCEPEPSPIVAIAADDEAARRLAEADVRSSRRAGRLRLSFHLYNDEHDVAAAASALR